MKVQDYFTQCEKELPGNRALLRRTSFCLRRAMVDTMETLCEMRYRQPDKLAHLRDIGPESLTMIDQVVRLYKEHSAAKSSGEIQEEFRV